MTTATLRLSTPIADAPAAPKQGLLARFYAAMIEARMRHAAQEIAKRRHLVPDHLLESSGYQVTQANDGALPFTR